MAWSPTDKEEIVSSATPSERVMVPRSVFVVVSKKSTLPVGVEALPTAELTVAVRVTGWARTDGLADEVTIVVVVSVTACTRVVAVELLLVWSGSVVVLLIVAVLLSTVPSNTLGLTWATTVKLAEALAANVSKVSLMVLSLLPSAKVGPEIWVCEIKVSRKTRLWF